MISSDWFEIHNIEEVDSPSIALYKEPLLFNIHTIIDLVEGDVNQLMVHIKTNKMPEVVKLLIEKGIHQFKASTIAEAEMAAREGANHVLIAHQLVGPKVQRFGNLVKSYPKTKFSTIIDNYTSLRELEEEAKNSGTKFNIYVDVNNGMNRSGIEMKEDLFDLINKITENSHLTFEGIHAYDGHLRDVNFVERNRKIEKGIRAVNSLFDKLKKKYPAIQLVCGGTPSFTSHLLKKDRVCSPGTCVLWDWGYSEKLKEQDFKFAALIVTRVISKPTEGIVTVDMGHKSVASENSIDKRIKFLNLESYELVSQSEEHGILKVSDWESIKVGDVFYGIPYHICPTINLHDEVSVISKQKKVATWDITARKRKITI